MREVVRSIPYLSASYHKTTHKYLLRTSCGRLNSAYYWVAGANTALHSLSIIWLPKYFFSFLEDFLRWQANPSYWCLSLGSRWWASSIWERVNTSVYLPSFIVRFLGRKYSPPWLHSLLKQPRIITESGCLMVFWMNLLSYQLTPHRSLTCCNTTKLSLHITFYQSSSHAS